MKAILDNIIFPLQKSGGISNVWFEFLYRITRKKDIELSFLDFENQNIFFQKLLKNNYLPNIAHSKRFLERYRNPQLNDIHEKFIFHSSYYRICKNPYAINITTVHDFTYEYYNHGLAKFIHSWQKRQAILKSDHIICISENTKKDLLHFIPNVAPEKISIVYNGVSDDYHIISSSETLNTLPFPSLSYVVFVGSRAKYKNFELTVQAISKTSLNLVIVGSSLNSEEQSMINKHFQKDNRIYCTGYIDNSQLNIVYNNAYALLYPSTYEGFGIPVLEAQKAGCPVIAYNGSSIPEIIGDTTLLMQEISTKEIHHKLEILKNKQVRTKIITEGIKNAQRFSWDKMYENIINIYQKVWESRNF